MICLGTVQNTEKRQENFIMRCIGIIGAMEEEVALLKEKMENAIKLRVPLIAEVSEATNWYDCK